MNYTLNQLRIFLSVVNEESVTKAANKLYMTQPAVSIQLKKFQDQFDIPLTEMIGKKIYITDFGKEIAAAARTILEEMERVETISLAHKGLHVGKLKISSASTGKYVMPYFLGEFLTEHKGIELMLDVANKSSVLECLEFNRTDFALVSNVPDSMDVNKIELMSNKLYLVAAKEYPIGNRLNLLSELESISLIYREKGSATRLAMENFLEQNRVKASKRIELVSNEAVKQSVLAGLGCSIVPLIGIKNELMRGDMRIVQAPGLPLVSTWNLVWMSQKKLSPTASFYLSYLKDNKQRLMDKYFNWYDEIDH